MANNPIDRFKGLTIKVISQVVDLTYHGVPTTIPRGKGILGQMLSMYQAPGNDSNGDSPPKSSASAIAIQVAEGTSNDEIDAIGIVRAGLIAQHAELYARVNTFHETLESEKRKLLHGRTQSTVPAEELKKLTEIMKPLNVGKVLKVKFQARIYTEDRIPGFNPVQDHGYSIVRTLYSLYVPYVDGLDDITAITADIAKLVAEGKSPVPIEEAKAPAIAKLRQRREYSPREIAAFAKKKQEVPTTVDIQPGKVVPAYRQVDKDTGKETLTDIESLKSNLFGSLNSKSKQSTANNKPAQAAPAGKK